MNSSEKFSPNPEFRVEKFDDEILLYAVSNTKGVYLNDTAHLVWEMCGQGKSLEEIVTLLENAYPEQKVAIRSDVQSAVQSLVDNNALVINNG